MTDLRDNRLVRTFAELRGEGRKTLVPFITAGYPDLKTTGSLLEDFESRGLRICELGVPFSDPVADGPVIQASYTEALAGGVTAEGIFETVGRYRARGGEMALVVMVSYSIVFRRGVQKYLSDCVSCGADALIVPDLPLEEAAPLEEEASHANLANVMLIAPTTPADRKRQIAAHSRGFIYYISIAGITGERAKLPPETIAAVEQLRRETQTPVCVGFGISNAATVAEVCKAADGAIVGSAIVHRMSDHKRRPKQLIKNVGGFVSELLKPLI